MPHLQCGDFGREIIGIRGRIFPPVPIYFPEILILLLRNRDYPIYLVLLTYILLSTLNHWFRKPRTVKSYINPYGTCNVQFCTADQVEHYNRGVNIEQIKSKIINSNIAKIKF